MNYKVIVKWDLLPLSDPHNDYSHCSKIALKSQENPATFDEVFREITEVI